MPRVRTIHFDGYAFRFKIEAQWYLVWKTLGVDVVYEPDTFVLTIGERAVHYLPDFEVPVWDAYVEIKYDRVPEWDACTKCHRLAIETGKDVYLFFRPPWERKSYGYRYEAGTGRFEPVQAMTLCPVCAALDVSVEGRLDALRCACAQPHPRLHNRDTEALRDAAVLAQRERFGA